ncbi:hypothetical protein QCBJ_29230 [Pseudomonas sp. QC2]|nr:hypothetical protein QCBJ_29230 [Pseudomonas sp. QC2]
MVDGGNAGDAVRGLKGQALRREQYPLAAHYLREMSKAAVDDLTPNR